MRKKNDFLQAFQDSSQLLAMLMDPDKVDLSKVENLVQHLPKATTHLFVGGSEVEEKLTEELVVLLKKQTELPIIIFPGDYTQITNEADALLFLSLLSGRNPEFLIEQQVKSVEK